MYNLLLNLLLNAVEAMPHGGSITVTTAEINGEIELSVADDGIALHDRRTA